MADIYRGGVDPADRLATLGSRRLSYKEVGATGTRLPADADHLARDVVIGRGREQFERAGEALMTWRMHRDAGATVMATAERAAVGVDVLVRIGPGSSGISAPCRVLHVYDTPERIGFTYGTLAGHPLSGEESFSVLLEPDETVRFVLIAFTRPGTSPLGAVIGRLGPIGRWISARMADRYARALRRAAAG